MGERLSLAAARSPKIVGAACAVQVTAFAVLGQTIRPNTIRQDRKSAQGRGRTDTSVSSHDFESCASANSATRADREFTTNLVALNFGGVGLLFTLRARNVARKNIRREVGPEIGGA